MIWHLKYGRPMTSARLQAQQWRHIDHLETVPGFSPGMPVLGPASVPPPARDPLSQGRVEAIP